jgi:hypothetical protein
MLTKLYGKSFDAERECEYTLQLKAHIRRGHGSIIERRAQDEWRIEKQQLQRDLPGNKLGMYPSLESGLMSATILHLRRYSAICPAVWKLGKSGQLNYRL